MNFYDVTYIHSSLYYFRTQLFQSSPFFWEKIYIQKHLSRRQKCHQSFKELSSIFSVGYKNKDICCWDDIFKVIISSQRLVKKIKLYNSVKILRVNFQQDPINIKLVHDPTLSPKTFKSTDSNSSKKLAILPNSPDLAFGPSKFFRISHVANSSSGSSSSVVYVIFGSSSSLAGSSSTILSFISSHS